MRLKSNVVEFAEQIIQVGSRGNHQVNAKRTGFRVAFTQDEIVVHLVQAEGCLAVHLESKHFTQIAFSHQRQGQGLCQDLAFGQVNYDFPASFCQLFQRL